MWGWKRLGPILLVMMVVCAFGAQVAGLNPTVRIPVEPVDDRPPVSKVGTDPEDAVGGEVPGKAGGAPIDLGGLSLLCGDRIEEYSLTGWVWVNGGATEETLKAMVQQAVLPLEAAQVKNDDLVWPTGTWNSGRVEEAWGVNYLRWLGDDRWVESWARSAGYREGVTDEGGMTYLVLRLTGLTGWEMASSLKLVMKDSLRRLGEERGTSIEVICWREGKIDDELMSGLVSRVLASAGASEVERSKRDDRLVVNAFSPLIPESVKRGGAEVNLQLAARYRKQDDRTYFHLGIPGIVEDY